MVMIPVSWGELIDKITILEIKQQKLNNIVAKNNVEKELALLISVCEENKIADIANLMAQLREVNMTIWNNEDNIRDHERQQNFSEEFIQLARLVYHVNDRRAKIKYEINQKLGSELVEEKSYQPY